MPQYIQHNSFYLVFGLNSLHFNVSTFSVSVPFYFVMHSQVIQLLIDASVKTV